MSEARFFLIAAGLHAVLPVMAIFAPEPAIEEAGAPIEVQVEIEVEPTRPPETPKIDEAVKVEAPRDVAPSPPSVEPRSGTASNVEPGPTGVPTSTEPQTTPAPTGSVVVAPPSTTGTNEYSGPPPMVVTGPNGGLSGLGISGPAWSIPGTVPDTGRPPPAPTTSPQATVDPKVATKVLTDAMKEKDKTIGLDLPAAGTVASSVRSVISGTNTPPESRATFEVKLSPTGQVLSVNVTSSTAGSGDAWAAAAKQLKAMLAGKTLGMTAAYSKGAVIYVSYSSTMTLPDGTKSTIQQKGAGATFDVANIGAHMQRVVKVTHSVVAVK